MADQKITQLTAHTLPLSSDVLPIVDVAGGSTKKVTIPVLNGGLFKALSSTAAGTDVSTAQPWFPAAGAVTVEANTTYFFRGYLRTTRSAGAVSHTTGLLFAGTATLTSIAYRAMCNTGDVVTNGTLNATSIEVATNTTVKAASTSTTEQIAVYVEGIVRINGAGTFIPQFQYSAAPGGAPTVMVGTYFQMYAIGSGSVTTQGTWA